MAILELRLLGGCEGRSASGQALELTTRKAWALLAYLALHPERPITRERLAGLLWGGRFDEQARASVRQTLYQLRRALCEQSTELLRAERDTVSLRGEKIDVDVLRLDELIRSDRAENLAEVGSLYRGVLLDGLEAVDPAFDEWLLAERARLQDRVCGALARLAESQLGGKDPRSATQTSKRLIEIEPLRENGHRLLMQALVTDGRRSEALKHFRDLERLLRDELGVAPDPETVQLRDWLLAENGSLSPAARDVEYEHEPDAPTTDPPQAGSQMRGSNAGRWRTVAAVAAASIALLLAGLGATHLRGPGPKEEDKRSASVLPAAPSLAVLPFSSFSEEPLEKRLAAGLTEDLITALSKTPQLLVIARTSVAPYADNPVKVQTIAEDLDVRYVLEGSVQTSGDDLRITAQLIDAATGHHLWSDRFDRRADDLFELQDDIVRHVLIELQVTLTEGDHVRVASRGTKDLEAWLLRLQAMDELYKFTRESTIRTRELLLAAHEEDPKWSRPLGGIAWSYWWEAKNGWVDDPEEWIDTGIAYAERAIELDPGDTLGYMQLGNLVQLRGDHERAIALRERAVEIAPNDFQANWGLGTVLYRAGDPDRAVEVLRHAMRLSPRHPAALVWTLAYAQLIAGRYAEAIESAERAAQLAPDRDIPNVVLAAARAASNREVEAAAAAAEVLRIDPDFRVSRWRRGMSDFKNPSDVASVTGLLIAAGLPE
jgi:TolB-like protein/DNA-binding SARP family transcriptional activator